MASTLLGPAAVGKQCLAQFLGPASPGDGAAVVRAGVDCPAKGARNPFWRIVLTLVDSEVVGQLPLNWRPLYACKGRSLAYGIVPGF